LNFFTKYYINQSNADDSIWTLTVEGLSPGRRYNVSIKAVHSDEFGRTISEPSILIILTASSKFQGLLNYTGHLFLTVV